MSEQQSEREAMPKFEDARVQLVYQILCSDDHPDGDEHWEGFAARRIVSALSKPSTEQGWRTIESAPMHQVVLVAVQGGHVSIGSRAPGIGWFWEPTDEESDDSCVTHWMPLPPPPIEPREEKL